MKRIEHLRMPAVHLGPIHARPAELHVAHRLVEGLGRDRWLLVLVEDAHVLHDARVDVERAAPLPVACVLGAWLGRATCLGGGRRRAERRGRGAGGRRVCLRYKVSPAAAETVELGARQGGLVVTMRTIDSVVGLLPDFCHRVLDAECEWHLEILGRCLRGERLPVSSLALTFGTPRRRRPVRAMKKTLGLIEGPD